MSRKNTIIFVLIALLCGVLSFLNARSNALNSRNSVASHPQTLLSETSDSVINFEQNFKKQSEQLMANLTEDHKSLVAALEDPCTPDASIMEKVEKVIASHELLIKRVGEHVVELRQKLPAENRDYLMQLCTETVKGQMSRLGARANESGSTGGFGRGGRRYGYGYGRQNGNRGNRAGIGQRLRFKERLANRLGLTQEQVTKLLEKDPDFEVDSVALQETLNAEKTKLLSVFENPQSSDEELLQQIDNLISTHSNIERRIAEHALIMRPYLTVEQQKWLIGLCRHSGSSM